MGDSDDAAYYQGCLAFGTEAMCDGVMERRLSGEEHTQVMSTSGIFDITMVCLCIFCAALAAGMTLGVVSLDAIELRVKMRTGTTKEKSYASLLLPLVERVPRHQVLVTLLLMNSFANEALPLFLDNLVPTWGAVIISVTAVLFVGEIMPSALFTGPSKLRIASAFVGVLKCILLVLSPLAYPLAWALDRLMPVERKYDSRQEIRALIEVQREAAMENGELLPFSEDECDLVRGAMTLSTTKIADVMVPIDRAFTLEATAQLDDDVLQAIHAAGYSRVPVVVSEEVDRYILVKDILTLFSFSRLPEKVTLGKLRMHAPLWIAPDHSLFELLNEFQTGLSHMAFVSLTPSTKKAAIGIITLEDIIECILTEEIYDEADRASARQTLRRFLRHTILPRIRSNSRLAAKGSMIELTELHHVHGGTTPPTPRPTESAEVEESAIEEMRRRGATYSPLGSSNYSEVDQGEGLLSSEGRSRFNSTGPRAPRARSLAARRHREEQQLNGGLAALKKKQQQCLLS